MAVWLVTGGSGFLGGHLLTELSTLDRSDLTVIALGRRCPDGWPLDRFAAADLEDISALARILDRLRPDLVLHLAGRTPPAPVEEFQRSNTGVTIKLIEALQASNRACRFVLVGSAAELGPVPLEDLPVAETYPCRPVGAYGQSKWQATRAALAASSPLEVVVARIFNPIGPGMPGSQALGRFALSLADGVEPLHLTVGDLDARRDFIDVRDVAAGLLALALRGQPGEVYHLGTGQSHSVRDGLERLITLSGRAATIEVSPELVGAKGPADSRADIRKIVATVGWQPNIDWNRSLEDLWSSALDRVRAGLTDPRPIV